MQIWNDPHLKFLHLSPERLPPYSSQVCCRGDIDTEDIDITEKYIDQDKIQRAQIQRAEIPAPPADTPVWQLLSRILLMLTGTKLAYTSAWLNLNLSLVHARFWQLFEDFFRSAFSFAWTGAAYVRRVVNEMIAMKHTLGYFTLCSQLI